ncbi:MAG TPA: hypothetical protein VFS41_02620, partial [Edaphobacter sp.]|nr:hypothetical protein [Edaphobacter sp.]
MPFGRRQLGAGVAAVLGEVELAAGRQRRRRHVVGAPPDLHLVLAVLRRRLGLVQPGEAAVVALVEAPVLLRR